ncbi:MAG: glucose 1-dehydrogenase [Geminicoccaceae bacterium]|nr:glucose 1-dehydrogenase [Geminicoccaceae bacterium]
MAQTSSGPFDLSGKIACVTGGNGGIGLGIAHGLREAGARVVVVGRNAEKNAAAVEALGGDSLSLVVDVADPNACARMVRDIEERAGGLDILIANAGINRRKRPETYTVEEWRQVIAVNLDAVFYCAHAAHPALRRRGGGKIVTIGSMLSLFGLPLATAYGASKGGVVQLSKGLAAAWAADGIQVNCILPGWIETDLTRQGKIDMPGLDERVRARTPAGRWGVPADLAGTAVFLSSAASDFVTGTAIPVDGGYSVQG